MKGLCLVAGPGAARMPTGRAVSREGWWPVREDGRDDAPGQCPRLKAPASMRVVYEDGQGILRSILAESTRRGFAIVQVATHQLEHDIRGVSAVAVTLELQGQPTVGPLTVALSDLDGVFEVATTRSRAERRLTGVTGGRNRFGTLPRRSCHIRLLSRAAGRRMLPSVPSDTRPIIPGPRL